MVHAQKQRDIIVRAGEMICEYLQIKPDVFLYNRPNGEPSIVEYQDPIQFMVPAPKRAKVIPTLGKVQCIETLFSLALTIGDIIKDNHELVIMKRWQFQALYHFMMEDQLRFEYDIDFENFKATVLQCSALCDANYYLATFLEDSDIELHTILEKQFTD